MNIDLDNRERWDATPNGGLYAHIVEGDHCTRLHGAGPTTVRHHHHAPKQWVALSERKCEDCGSTGWVYDGYVGDDPTAAPCSDCLGSGRQLVGLTVPCDECSGAGGWVHFNTESWIACPRCTNGRLSIGKGTVEGVVQIVSMTAVSSYPCISVNIEALEPDVLLERNADGDCAHLDLGENPEQYVGTHWGVIVRRQS